MSNIQEIKITREQLNILNDRGEIYLQNERSGISIEADIVKSNSRIEHTDSGWEIDDTLIDENIFQEEKYDYYIVDVEDEIDNIIMWIGEAQDESQKDLMKNDLSQLMNCKEDYILSSMNTNEYIDSTFGDVYNGHCDAILKLNK